MSQSNPGPTKTFTAGAALSQFARVKLSTGKLAAAGLADGAAELGTLEEAAFADLDVRAVLLANAPGSRKMIAAKSISAGATVYTAASGKISDAAATGATKIGIALEAATADGDIIEVLYKHFNA